MEEEISEVGSSSLSTTARPSLSQTSSLKSKDETLKLSKKLSGFLVERKLSQEEIEERYEFIQAHRSKSSLNIVKDQSGLVHRASFSDALNGLYSAKFSSNGETIATTYGSGCIQLRSGETGELRATIRSGLEMSLPVTCCRFHPIRKEILYAGSACGSIFMCKVDEIEFWKFIEEEDNEINAIDISVSGEYIVSGGKDTALRIYDAETAKLIKLYKGNKDDLITDNAVKFHHMKIFATKCHQMNSNIFITGGWDGTVKIWDVRVGDGSIRSINGPHICGDAIDLQDTKILTGSWVFKDSLQLWDLNSGKLIDTINPVNRQTSTAGEYLYCARYFDGDPYGDHVIVGGSATGNVEVINLKNKSIMAYFSNNKATIAVDSYRTNIVYGGMDPVISIAQYD